jgi:hypothetical protein
MSGGKALGNPTHRRGQMGTGARVMDTEVFRLTGIGSATGTLSVIPRNRLQHHYGMNSDRQLAGVFS